MSVELYAVGEYKGTTILLKKGNCLKDFPYYFTDEFAKPFICKYLFYSNIAVNLHLEEGLAGQIMELPQNGLAEAIERRGTKRPKAGELIFVNQYLTHWESLILIVLYQLENPNEDDRIEIVEHIKNGFDSAEDKGVDAIVTNGLPLLYSMFDIEMAANIIFEAMEMFLDSRSSENIRIISFCIENQEEIDMFVQVARERFKRYSTWMFLKGV
jgi:hypothetical protein